MKIRKILSFIFLNLWFLSLMSSSPALRGYSDDLFTHMDDKLLDAQGEFEAMYKDLLEQDFINEMDIKKADKVQLSRLFHGLCKFKVSNEKSTRTILQPFVYPFRATLAKAMIFILIVNQADLSYKEKVKHTVYYLDKIKRELLEIKKSLSNCSVTENDIDKFIEFMQAYSTEKPILKPSFLKTLFKIVCVILVVAVVICIVIYFVAKKSGESLEAFRKRFLADTAEHLGEELDKLDRGEKSSSSWKRPILVGLNFLADRIRPARPAGPPAVAPQPQAQAQQPAQNAEAYAGNGWASAALQSTKNAACAAGRGIGWLLSGDAYDQVQ